MGGMHVALSRDGNQRIPFGRTHVAKLNTEAVEALLPRDWGALAFVGVDLPGTPSFDD